MAENWSNNDQVLYNQYNATVAQLRQAGMPRMLSTVGAGQAMMESNQFRSNVAQQDNNFTGIMWINKPYQKATRGRAYPKSESGGKPYFYAHYANGNDWANDFVRILKINGPMGRPIDAPTALDYFTRLKANGYFKAPLDSYMKAYNSWATQVNNVVKKANNIGLQAKEGDLQEVAAKATDYKPSDDTEAYGHDIERWFKSHWKTVAVVGVGLIVLSKVTRS